MNGTSRSDQNYVLHENLRRRNHARFVGRGFIRACRKLYIILIVFCVYLGFILIAQIQGNGFWGAISALLWRIILRFALSIATIAVFFFLGAPRGYIRIMRRLERVPNFRNGDKEPPLLWKREIIDTDSRVEKWTMKSYGIGFGDWVDPVKQPQIENALDISILGVEYGSDNTVAVLKVLHHPGPWPAVIPWDRKYLPVKASQLCVGLNRSYPIVIDLAVHPHYMIGGETGSGKTVLIKSIMLQALMKDFEASLIDMKHFVDYVSILPQLRSAVDEEDELTEFLSQLVAEMHRRLSVLKEAGCANIEKFNEANPGKPMKRILCVIDEYMEAVVKTGSKEQKNRGEKNEEMIASLCKLARAAGISMILGLQRGGQEISGQIRSNTRVLLGSCNDNLSIVMTGSTELGRMIPPDSVGMFVTDNRQLFKSFYGGFEV